MKYRIAMSSKSLQDKFPEIYREFFSKCPIVVSAPTSFFWTGEYVTSKNGRIIVQRLPFRIYIGLEPISGDKLIFGSRTQFYCAKQKFIKKNELSESHYQRGIKLVTDSYKGRGFRIHILAENLSWLGTNTSAAAGIALPVALSIANNKINSSEIAKYSRREQGASDSRLKSIFSIAKSIERELNGGCTTGITSSSLFFESKAPIISLTPEGQLKEDFSNIIQWLPINFILIYVYEETDPVFLTSHVFKNPIWPQASKIINYLSREISKTLSQVLTKSYSTENMARFFSLINQNYFVSALLGLTTPTIDRIVSYGHQFADRKKIDPGVGMRILGAGGGGSILLVIPKYCFYDYLDSFLDQLRKITAREISYNFISWLGEKEEKGVIVEQSLSEGIYSKFISEGSVSLKSFTKEEVIQTEITSLEDFDKEKEKVDLLLDAIEGDVYIRGKKLTSKEIPSSSATVEILTILLENLGKSIANDKLPESSYSQDRNEMQSKIVSPLIKVVKKITKKTLPLKVTGGLIKFRVKLEPSDLDIKILNKIF